MTKGRDWRNVHKPRTVTEDCGDRCLEQTLPRSTQQEPTPAHTLTSGCGLQDRDRLMSNVLSHPVWHFVTAAPGNEHANRTQKREGRSGSRRGHLLWVLKPLPAMTPQL